MIPAAVRLRAGRLGRRGGRGARPSRRRRQGARRRPVAASRCCGCGWPTRRCSSTSAGSSEMRGVREDGDHLVIGAMTTHHEVMHDPLVRQHARAGRRRRPRRSPTRRSGTAAPSAARSRTPTRPATCRRWRWPWTPSSSSPGSGGRRTVAAADFFVDYLQTALAPDEVLVEVRVPKLGAGWGYRYEKFHRVAQAWAIVGVAAAVRRDNGSIAEARVGADQHGADPGPRAPASRRRWPARALDGDRRGGRARRRRHESPERPERQGGLPRAPCSGADAARGHGRRRGELTGCSWSTSSRCRCRSPRHGTCCSTSSGSRRACPGATVESFDGETIVGRVKVKVGPIQVTYAAPRGSPRRTRRPGGRSSRPAPRRRAAAGRPRPRSPPAAGRRRLGDQRRRSRPTWPSPASRRSSAAA